MAGERHPLLGATNADLAKQAAELQQHEAHYIACMR